ncbi:KGGVGR-motif variant AAA ATPase [Streptomyces daliensis]|uniref:AAA family ATPase n=1 Tax=Streptomyces daliensis TaxID=299421 RepID=A0A8T4INA1_9ACTN|nr:AAA family ATPase [Streptomyces daliensis]
MTVPPAPVRFDQAQQLAMDFAREAAGQGADVLVVRDILGRLSLALDDREPGASLSAETVAYWRTRMAEKLGSYAMQNPVILASELFVADQVFDSPRILPAPIPASEPGQGRIRLLNNTVVGEDWAHVMPLQSDEPASRSTRTALYGFKGGVGRSTATYMLAQHLADQDLCVLVVDLDLESPGSGPLLLSGKQLPEYGLIDYLVEAAVGNAENLDLVARASQVTTVGNGELWVAPAAGRGPTDGPYTYIDKLNRVYADTPSAGAPGFAERLEAAVTACEEAVQRRSRRPDAVLLDSRAGIHDIAAVTISRLADLTLLFGSDNGQTWAGYRNLFTAWNASGQATAIRERLRMVAAMVPDTRRVEYLEAFREHAWECFSVLYDDQTAEDPTGFNPAPEDIAAPHAPIPILFSMELVGLDGASARGWSNQTLVRAAYGEFLDTASRLIVEGS